MNINRSISIYQHAVTSPESESKEIIRQKGEEKKRIYRPLAKKYHTIRPVEVNSDNKRTITRL